MHLGLSGVLPTEAGFMYPSSPHSRVVISVSAAVVVGVLSACGSRASAGSRTGMAREAVRLQQALVRREPIKAYLCKSAHQFRGFYVPANALQHLRVGSISVRGPMAVVSLASEGGVTKYLIRGSDAAGLPCVIKQLPS
jgi:hypothetical protein